MFCIALFALLLPASVSEETCPAEEGSEFCKEDRKVRHEVRYRDISPSYCYLGNKEDFQVHKRRSGVKRCGWPGISQRVCERSGCCFKDDKCYHPIRPAEVMTFFRKSWVTFQEAHEQCALGFLSLYCVQHEEDLEFVTRATCGITWMAGQLGNGSKLVDTESQTCGQGDPVNIEDINCERNPRGAYSLSMSRSGGKFGIANVPIQEKRNLLCSYEIWTPTFERFPEHILNGTRARSRWFKCRAKKLTVDGRGVLNSTLTWTISDTSGNTIREVINQEKIEAKEIGKYTCEVKMQLIPGILPDETYLTNERKITAYAYHYLPVQPEVRISIKSSSESKARVYKTLVINKNGSYPTFPLLLSDKVTLELKYQGFPLPEVKILSSSSDPEYEDKEHFHLGEDGTWILENFGEMSGDHNVWMYHDTHVEEVQINFKSETEVKEDKLEPIRFSLKKVYIVLQIDTPEREFTLPLNRPHSLQCYGSGVSSLPETHGMWTIDGMSLEDRGVEYEETDPQRGYIQIVPDSALYSGVYLCILKNGAGSVNVTYTIQVEAPPLRPLPPEIDQSNPEVLKYTFPVSQDIWDITNYHVTISSSDGEFVTVTLPVNNGSIPEDRGNFTARLVREGYIEISQTGVDTVNVRYKMEYSLSNKFGTSESTSSIWTVLQSELNTDLTTSLSNSTEHKIKNDTIILKLRDRNKSLNYKVTYYPLKDISQSRSATFTGTTGLKIEPLKNGTRYMFSVQASKTKGNITEVGPPTHPIMLRTMDEMFNTQTHKPKELDVQQIWYEKGVFPSVVVLIKWKFPHSLTLVENFMLKVRKGTVADITISENENEYDSSDNDMEKRSKKVMNLLVSRDNIPRNSTSIMLKIERFKADNVYNFFLWTVSAATGRKSAPATAQLKFSRERCPVPPPQPKICGVLVNNDHDLIVMIEDETIERDSNTYDCYTGNGTEYKGHVHRTKDGELCQKWDATQSQYSHLEKNLCRNPGNPADKIFHRPWCYTAENKSSTCDVPPCGQYLTQLSLPSGEKTLAGTQMCVKKMKADREVSLVTWYDYGLGAATCRGNETQLDLHFGDGMLVESKNEGQKKYDSFRKTIWYKYIWLLIDNLAIMIFINLIIYCRQRIVKKLERERKEEKHQENITKALSASESTH